MVVPSNADRGDIEAAAWADERIKALLAGKTLRKIIVIPGKLVNFVVDGD